MASVVGSLAWPATLIVVLVLIRKELPGIARSLRKLKYKDVELEFGEAAKQVAVEAKDVISLPADAEIAMPSQTAERKLRFSTVPAVVILQAFLRLEGVAVEALSCKVPNVRWDDVKSPSLIGRALRENGILDDQQFDVFDELRRLRNQVLHGVDDLASESAENYLAAAERLIAFLHAVAKNH